MRLDQYLVQHWPEYSRAQWQKYIVAGYVTVNGLVETSTKRQLGEDDEVVTNVPVRPVPDALELPVIYEDSDVIVINKPAGVLTHAKGELADEFTVADFLRTRTTDGLDGNRPGIVHRLDRDTSGVLIGAKNTSAKHQLQKQFQDRKAKKVYLAVVKGTPKLSEAIIDLPIERNPQAPATFRVGASGKSAQTAYTVVASNGTYSVVELRPVTGRTHQLRVHLAYIGTPIVGDRLYRGGTSPIGRLCLHAKSLEITVTGSERLTFEADLPLDFSDFIGQIRG